MDPCPFVRILVGNLAIKFPTSSRSSVSRSTSSCFCKIKLKNFPTQQATIPLLHQQEPQAQSQENNYCISNSLAACFNLDKTQINKITSSTRPTSLILEIYTGGEATCGFSNGKLLGKVTVPLDLKKAESRPCVIHNGWIGIGEKNKVEFYLCVRAEPDPRYVFQFGGEPECSPQVFQVQGSVRQAVFTCKFSLRNPGDRNLGQRQSMLEPSTSRNWLPSLGAEKDQSVKERKGWTITIHDLSGSPVAMAAMVTPFVPSPGSDRVSRSNPGAWLILRPSLGTWKPWGRLEAWREHPKTNELGYRFELIHDTATATPTTTTLVNSLVNSKNGGKFTIDTTNSVTTPVCSPHSSCDFGSGSGSGSWSGSEFGAGLFSQFLYRGFVMSSTVKGNSNCSKPEVEIGVQHVNCTEDAAAFVALAAAMDLSMDACRLFSQKLRKELRQQSQSFVV
ncbi:uncharacterized protein LOC8268889 [Ricinus communis]|uniref:Uncharacterized protein n=1 Tax=Ricinus communis TaxID=3988 RepID=B9S7W2_RICCO|nr:uncharacterized protein LOC8268889 [Ricinus communis]EEF40278.1 conserved hypothetical protein [Ricinus communis]|eukprot:XP_002522078.1 uncharacterized protein LOC8268889 [Ricinus communis]